MGATATATHFRDMIHYFLSYITDVCEQDLHAQLAHGTTVIFDLKLTWSCC